MKKPTLRDYPWKISYSSDTNNPVAEFYIPALECAIQYDRKSGFFNSAILSKVARGLGAMLHNQGYIRLIMGCQFSPQDLKAIQQGYELRDTLATRLDIALTPPASFFAQLKHFEILSWLIQNGYLDIRIAVPLKADGSLLESVLDPHHIFHDLVAMDAEADLAEIHQPLPSTPIPPEIEQLFTTSALLKACGVVFKPTENHTYQLTYQGQNYAVTFKPEVFDQIPSTRLMSFGDPLFESLVQIASGVV